MAIGFAVSVVPDKNVFRWLTAPPSGTARSKWFNATSSALRQAGGVAKDYLALCRALIDGLGWGGDVVFTCEHPRVWRGRRDDSQMHYDEEFCVCSFCSDIFQTFCLVPRGGIRHYGSMCFVFYHLGKLLFAINCGELT